MRRTRPAVVPIERRRTKARLALLVGLAGALLAAGPATAALPTAPTGDVRVSVSTPSGWTVEERGPSGPKDQRTTQLVVRAPGGAVDALLYPEAAVKDLCDPEADGFHCLPLRAVFVQDLKMGTKGLVVTDRDGDGTPEVAISMFSGGAHCCVTAVGYWRDAAGGWKSDVTNGGSLGGDRTDATGRLRVANPGFEGLDWSYAATQGFFTWSRLVPGTGWVDATTKAEHRAQITAMDRVVRRWAGRKDAGEVVQAARAVRIGHRRALGQKARVASERRTYRRAYGRASARSLDRVLKTVVTVR